jgi:hypothetical protein
MADAVAGIRKAARAVNEGTSFITGAGDSTRPQKLSLAFLKTRKGQCSRYPFYGPIVMHHPLPIRITGMIDAIGTGRVRVCWFVSATRETKTLNDDRCRSIVEVTTVMPAVSSSRDIHSFLVII